MGLHDLEFLRCQTTGFIQNLLRDEIFPISCRADALTIRAISTVTAESDPSSQQLLRSISVMTRICSTWSPLSPLRNSTMLLRIQPSGNYSFLIYNLLRHHAFQNLLLRIEHKHITHAAQYRLFIKRAADIIGRSQIISMFNIAGGRLLLKS